MAVLIIGSVVGWVIWRKNRIYYGPTFGATSRIEWIERAITHVNGFKPRPWTPRPWIFNEFPDRCIFWLEGKGLVEFQDGNWAYVVTHSFHGDEKYQIGDICIARDRNGNLWQSDEHPCSCIVLEAKSNEGFEDIKEFLEQPAATSLIKWEPMMLPNNH